MGSSQAKPALGISSMDALKQAATVSFEDAAAIQRKTESVASTAISRLSSGLSTRGYIAIGFAIIAIGIGGLFLYEWLALKFGWPTLGILSNLTTLIQSTSILYIDSATYNNVDVSTYLRSQIANDSSLRISPVNATTLKQPAAAVGASPGVLTVSYHIGGDPVGNRTITVNENDSLVLPDPGYTPSNQNKGYVSMTAKSLTSGLHDATTPATVSAPISRDSSYGTQWWMFVKDWNYGFGKDKSVLKRPDTTNSAVMNPNISLHPTDNSLKISVSIFPQSEGGSSKLEPAPAGHSGATDDVFICEVPNIPLQTWFSVAVTVFQRNLDVYINGKLVKSCFLSGVPKPAVGDYQLTSDGGFSGYICDVTHVTRMLTPSDAMSFYSAGTACSSSTSTTGVAGTGYSVKFGVYDTLGKEVQEYTF